MAKIRLIFCSSRFSTGICTFRTETRLVSETKFLDKYLKTFFLQNYLNHTILAIHPITDYDYRDMYREVENLYKFL